MLQSVLRAPCTNDLCVQSGKVAFEKRILGMALGRAGGVGTGLPSRGSGGPWVVSKPEGCLVQQLWTQTVGLSV